MPPAHLRPATQSDLPALAQLLAELVETIEDEAGIDRTRVHKNCQALLSAPDSFILVAEMGNTIVGLVNFNLRQALLHSGPSALIDELIVTEAFRGKGVGTQLVDAAVEQCKQLGCCEIEVSTETANDRARAFYQRCGFEEKGVLFERDIE